MLMLHAAPIGGCDDSILVLSLPPQLLHSFAIVVRTTTALTSVISTAATHFCHHHHHCYCCSLSPLSTPLSLYLLPLSMGLTLYQLSLLPLTSQLQLPSLLPLQLMLTTQQHATTSAAMLPSLLLVWPMLSLPLLLQFSLQQLLLLMAAISAISAIMIHFHGQPFCHCSCCHIVAANSSSADVVATLAATIIDSIATLLSLSPLLMWLTFLLLLPQFQSL